ncbi:AAC(3) family N-acetyltransferase [Pseudomonas sp. SWRI107]|uniref:AAC(3) family N-acetyltransferase n=1 Tax=Pseudomonas TaxID=286 RepID=UPI001647BBC6|nr:MULTISPECIES: AAC(3) family N-acetyltransferase [Pseudomonas]MBC3410857.1 AAC(3) family N-acetyltransferase [Pseudomonas sp. SWRI51]MBV4530494.1 AAC(3) family N-acetyltransferase [Pseudomonas farsensis]
MSDKIVKTLACEWQAAGIERGDIILIHSSISRLLRRLVKSGAKADPALIVQSLLIALGEEGTLVAPLFNFDFTQGIAFDIRTSKSAMGALTESVRQWPGAVRTGHPIYSFAIVGKHAPAFAGIDNFSGYGADSPFAVLHQLDGKIGVIDLPEQHSMTFYHYVEESLSAPYRYHKTFSGPYTDAEGLTSERRYGLFVRDIEQGVLTHVNPMGELLWENGFYSGTRPGIGSGMRVVKAATVFNEASRILKEGKAKGILYEVQQ